MAKRVPGKPPIISGFNYLRVLGTGGFSDVFLYQQDMPRRLVAVKVMLQDKFSSAQIRMFNAEANVLAKLSAHPNILTIFQASIASDGRPYLVMEYCPDGISPRYRNQQLAVAEVLNIGIKIAGAVETVHNAGLLHRDIKPSNILLSEFGAPVLSDFGIALAQGTLTSEFVAMSVPWSAPEIIRQEHSGSIATEVWSLGACVYSLLAGKSPFERAAPGNNTRDKLAYRISQAKFAPILRPDLPAQVNQVLAKAMSKKPEDRYSSAALFAQALQQVQYSSGFTITALELDQAGWVGKFGQIDFSDSSVSGVVRSVVPQDSKRKRAVAPALSDQNILDEKQGRFVPKGAWWLIAGSAALLCVTVILYLVWSIVS